MHPWLYDGRRVKDGHWESKKNRIKYLKWLGEKLDFITEDDWYKLKPADLKKYKGFALYVDYYNQNRIALLSELYPDYYWLPWSFHSMPMNTWNDIKNRRDFFDWIFIQEKFKTMEDWYTMKGKEFLKYPGGYMINNLYKGSPRKAIKDIYPEFDWKDWMFVHSPPGFWNNDDNCLKYIEWVKIELGYTKMEDWYDLQLSKLSKKYYGAGIHRRFGGSAILFLEYFFPDYDWIPWKFYRVGNNFWNKQENIDKYIKWLSIKIGIKKMEDWYEVSGDIFKQNYGSGLLKDKFDFSHTKLLKSCFPDYNWLPWKFTIAPKNFWKEKINVIWYLNWLEGELGIKDKNEWYKINKDDFIYGESIIYRHYDGYVDLLMTSFPEYNWLPWKFERKPDGFWDIKENRIKYMKWLEEKLEIKNDDDWYTYNTNDIRDNFGSSFLELNHLGSYVSIVKEYKPNIKWLEWKFNKTPNGFWTDKENCKRYMKWVEDELRITKLSQWYVYDRNILYKYHGGGILAKYQSSLKKILLDIYPDYDWDIGKLIKIGKNELQLLKIIKNLFPREKIKHNYKHETMRFTKTNRKMELDIFIPSLKLAFEYQGEQHFDTFWQGTFELGENQSLEANQNRDKEKRNACNNHGITLIEIDYKWDKTSQFVEKILVERDITFHKS